ncbi:methionyl aminopeptidase [Nematocida parisii]|uniref:Methionine aminopeptidase n=1 Tax=Nematocida parisii (strain ERTm3) TaxID=935791 RepID=I3EEP4_NEMP3|nr:methionine aminopeptidase [Nematocida parisii ERTm1]EIJ87691.1 methionine aminopeptidase [Nematocida parisii ERTm3]KAI5144030.1 methionyl aminopeptidase [Nematocida parisii]EIJ92921.1 methionine aminopeptidase [Nematocida parisii ERTm1]KAI5154102.1 methionyl aminopeptidase [Nematocida parisii]KAI5157540.1 methionyl aminopeptidase [Nematocida parisii]|eukprot:XP_013060147.1 methionine aminopeptidase [Nematocida parisii ERTm1]
MFPQLINKVVVPELKNILVNEQIGILSPIESARLAATAHKMVRQNLQAQIRPGMTLLEMAEIVENGTKTVLGQGYNKGIGFPTGLSLNSCAAHDSPNPKSHPVVLAANDILKVDFGTHVNGYIIDSAFTVCFNPDYDNLLLAARESVYECLKLAGPDAPIKDIADKAEEVIRSYELTIDGRSVPIRPVTNLNGHSINQYKIHGGKYVPIIKNSGNKSRMLPGEFFAIETFATTGNGYVNEKGDCSHYMISNPNVHSKLEGGKTLMKYIQNTFSTLPFCKRYIDPTEIKSADTYINYLTKIGGIDDYPPLYDSPGSLVSQFEHTLYVNESGIEVLSRGDDY